MTTQPAVLPHPASPGAPSRRGLVSAPSPLREGGGRSAAGGSTAGWIWLEPRAFGVAASGPTHGPPPRANLYALFRRVVNVRAGESRRDWRIRVSVAGNYALSVNGAPAAFGQYSDWPQSKTYTETSLAPFVREGGNEIEIAVWFSGNRFSSHYDGEPGLWAEILRDGEVVDGTTEDWLAALDLRFEQGERTILFVSLDWTFAFDARRAPGEFRPAVAAADRPSPVARPLPPPVARPFVAGRVVSEGCGYRVFDFDEERAGLLRFTLSAAGGERVEIVHGEYLKNGRLQDFEVVGNPSNPRRVVDAYVCRGGRQTFVHRLRRLGCRFLEFRYGASARVDIEEAGLLPVEHEGLETPPFSCGDALLGVLHEVSCRTLRLCLHEKYENCPWREQSICEYDARNQMLFGYPVWGNYAHAAAMIRLFAGSETPLGFLTAIAPSASKTLIPMFTFPWIVSIAEHYLYSGDFGLFRELSGQVERMLGKILALRAGELYAIPETGDYWVWNYCEPRDREFCANPPNAFYNLYLREALLAIAPLFREAGRDGLARDYEAVAARLGAACERIFWNEGRGAYADAIAPGGVQADFYGHVQALFLAHGLPPAGRARRALDAVKGGAVPFPELSALLYLVRGVHRCGDAADRAWLHGKIREVYGRQIEAGATTWWESLAGTDYAGGGGSLCHGWSALPAWYLAEYVLGVRPVAPGYERYVVEPAVEGLVAHGRVVTPRGVVEV